MKRRSSPTRGVAAEGADGAAFEDAQQLGLHVERQGVDVVEVDGAALGADKKPALLFVLRR